jgi:hypothetical protein
MGVNTQVTDLPNRRIRYGDKSQVPVQRRSCVGYGLGEKNGDSQLPCYGLRSLHTAAVDGLVDTQATAGLPN